MGWIDSPKRRKELAAFHLEIEWQIRRLEKGFLHFDLGLVVVIEFENDVGETFEVGIDRAVERELDVAGVESTLLRIVIANFDVIEVARA